jgi:GNAT superfamily N-acetyltransferase
MTDSLPPALPDGFELSDDVRRIDRPLVHRWLSEEAYWALGRPREVQERAIDASWNFGVYRGGSGEQVAYARLVTDRATFAWICDVFVDTSVRGLGIGTALMAGVMAALEPMRMRRVALATESAHGLYAKFGFEPLPNPERWMSLGP